MPGFMPGIHVSKEFSSKKDVDGREKSGHD